MKKSQSLKSYFKQNPNRLITKGEILREVWAGRLKRSTRSVDQYIAKIRADLKAELGRDSVQLVTVPASGWIWFEGSLLHDLNMAANKAGYRAIVKRVINAEWGKPISPARQKNFANEVARRLADNLKGALNV